MKATPFALALLAAVATGCAGSSSPDASGGAPAAPKAAASGPPTAQTFFLKGNDQDEFVPETFAAKVGTLELTLQNGDVPHNVVFDDDSLPGIPTIRGDERKSVSLTFPKAGTYTFVCTIHPGMDGAVVVS